MSIIFNYLFTRTGDGYQTRVCVSLLNGPPIDKGLKLTVGNLNGVDLALWEGKSLTVTVENGVYRVSGLVD